jgi:hypothetical protein
VGGARFCGTAYSSSLCGLAELRSGDSHTVSSPAIPGRAQPRLRLPAGWQPMLRDPIPAGYTLNNSSFRSRSYHAKKQLPKSQQA